MFIFPVPITVIQQLESLRARFCWGADRDDRCMHWIRWDRVTGSRADGGLDSLYSFNSALLLLLKMLIRVLRIVLFMPYVF